MLNRQRSHPPNPRHTGTRFVPSKGLPTLIVFLKGSGRGCPLLRASNEHILIVRVLRARRAPGRSLPLLADFFSILLRLRVPSQACQHTFDFFLHHRIFIFEQRKQGVNGLLRSEPSERFRGIPTHRPVFILERLDQRIDSTGTDDFPQGLCRHAALGPKASAAWRRTIQLLPSNPSIKASTARASPIFFSTGATSSRTV